MKLGGGCSMLPRCHILLQHRLNMVMSDWGVDVVEASMWPPIFQQKTPVLWCLRWLLNELHLTVRIRMLLAHNWCSFGHCVAAKFNHVAQRQVAHGAEPSRPWYILLSIWGEAATADGCEVSDCIDCWMLCNQASCVLAPLQRPANWKFPFESNLESNRRLQFEFESNLESNRRIVVYIFNVKFLLIDEKQRGVDSSKILHDRY